MSSDDTFAIVFDANGVELRLQKVEHLTPQPFTSLDWQVSDIHRVLARLAARKRPSRAICVVGTGRRGCLVGPEWGAVAWFKDPDGNLLSVAQYPAG